MHKISMEFKGISMGNGSKTESGQDSCGSKGRATLYGIFHSPECSQINKSLGRWTQKQKNYELHKKAINSGKEVETK